MSGIRRGIILTIGLIAFLTLAIGAGALLYSQAEALQKSYEHRAEKQAKSYADRARIGMQRCFRNRVPPEAKQDCARQEAQAAREGAHDEYDLQAQMVTSVWTRAMGIAAIIAMVMGIMGVGLVFITFRETRRSAEAAHAANRPWLKFTHLNVPEITFTPPSKGEPHGSVKVKITGTAKNIGKAPAKGVVIYPMVWVAAKDTRRLTLDIAWMKMLGWMERDSYGSANDRLRGQTVSLQSVKPLRARTSK